MRRGQSRRGGQPEFDQSIEYGILIALPPFLGRPVTAVRDVESVQRRRTRQLHGFLFLRQPGAADAEECDRDRGRSPALHTAGPGTSCLSARPKFAYRRLSCEVNCCSSDSDISANITCSDPNSFGSNRRTKSSPCSVMRRTMRRRSWTLKTRVIKSRFTRASLIRDMLAGLCPARAHKSLGCATPSGCENKVVSTRNSASASPNGRIFC